MSVVMLGEGASFAHGSRTTTSSCEIIGVQTWGDASFCLQNQSVEVILIKLPFEDWTPEALLYSAQSIAPAVPVVFCVESAHTAEAVRLARMGALQVLTEDLVEQELPAILESARVSKRSHSASTEEPAPWQRFLVGASWPMKRIGHVIRLVAAKRCTILITGETGTGKEMVARALHRTSPRAQRPMISVNCSALPEDLLEAELFGHVKGAFTGAYNNRIGRFEQAHDGTIFLDEIGEIPLKLQAKLLRVLQEREFQRVGSSETVCLDVRVMAASNRHLPDLIRAGQFREDLYYRLNVIPIQIPPLRERRDDVAPLVFHFIDKYCRLEDIPTKTVCSEAVERLAALPWPGNVRQLENCVEMAVALSGDRSKLGVTDFPILLHRLPSAESALVMDGEGLDYAAVVDEFERSILKQALHMTKNNKSAAADLLSLKRSTFVAKLQSLGVLGPEGLSEGGRDLQLAAITA